MAGCPVVNNSLIFSNMENATEYPYFDQVVKDKPFGWKYTQPMRIPYFWWEEVDHFFWPTYMGVKRHYAYVAAVIYVLGIYGLRIWMRNRKPMDLKGSLFLWNFGLGVFSLMGFWRSAPGFLYLLFGVENGFYKSVCKMEHLDVQGMFWMMVFVFSKFVELGDTVFIVLRKRPLPVLQCYHHMITMMVSWILAPTVEPIARWYSVMNYGSHSLLYFYFAARAVGIKVPTLAASFITTLQLLQMIVGLGVNVISIGYLKMGYECARSPISIQLFTMVYGSFLVLFGKFFFDTVVKKKHKRKQHELKTEQIKKVD